MGKQEFRKNENDKVFILFLLFLPFFAMAEAVYLFFCTVYDAKASLSQYSSSVT